MTSEEGINRISLRVPADVFEKLKEKNFRGRTSFQQVGLALFERWLTGEQTAEPTSSSGLAAQFSAEERALIDKVIAVLRSGDVEHADAMKRVIKVCDRAVGSRRQSPRQHRSKRAG